MNDFWETLKTQRWDDHRYYHHSLVNQSLHLVSATSFICAYVVMFWDPAMAALIAWLISMTSRQIGHFFFEPKGFDTLNQATHKYKETIKVGYNLKRKVVLHAIWGLSPLALVFEPTLFGMIRPWDGFTGFFHNLGLFWLFIGVSALIFRTIHLFFWKIWKRAWFGRSRSSPTRSTTSRSTTRRRIICCAAISTTRSRSTTGAKAASARSRLRPAAARVDAQASRARSGV